MKRIFKIPRRRPHVIDLYTPLTQGLDQFGYRVSWAPNFDAATFTAIINSTNVGYLDPNVQRNKIETQPTTGTDVRIVFDPSSFTTPLTGTYDVTNGSPSVPTSTTQVGVVYSGSSITFGAQPGVSYTVESVNSTTITLTADYTGTSNATTTGAQGINDSVPFWLQVSRIQGGSPILTSAPTLILPDYANKGIGIVTIAGNAPSATGSADALQIDFPSLMQNLQITNNDGTNNLYVSTEQNGPEATIGPKLGFYGYSMIYASQSSIWVRGGTSGGSGATVSFSATMTLSFPR